MTKATQPDRFTLQPFYLYIDFFGVNMITFFEMWMKYTFFEVWMIYKFFFGIYALCSMTVCMSMIYMTNIFKLSEYYFHIFFASMTSAYTSC